MSNATDAADKIIHVAIYDVALKAAKAAALAEAPWLRFPVISSLFDFMLGKFAGWVYGALDKAVVFAIIDIETQAQRHAYDSAVAEIKAKLAKPNPTPEEIEKARQELEKRLGDLIGMHP